MGSVGVIFPWFWSDGLNQEKYDIHATDISEWSLY